MKLIRNLIILGAVTATLVGAAVITLLYWEKLISLAVAGKELLDTVLKSVLPEKLQKDDMTDYYDI